MFFEKVGSEDVKAKTLLRQYGEGRVSLLGGRETETAETAGG